MRYLYEYVYDITDGTKKSVFNLNFGRKKFISRFDNISTIYRGSNNNVIYLVKRKKTEDKYVCKVVPAKYFAKTEVTIPVSIESSRILKPLECYQCYANGEDSVYIISEYYPDNIDVFEYLNANRSAPEEDICSIFWKMCLSIRDVHNAGYCHGDIKAENFLITDVKSMNIILIDFGFSFKCSSDEMYAFNYGTKMYIAPEIIEHRTGNRKSDIWSLGSCLYYVLLNKAYRYNINIVDDIKAETKISEEVKELLFGCLDENIETRWDINRVLESKWFRKQESFRRQSEEPSSVH